MTTNKMGLVIIIYTLTSELHDEQAVNAGSPKGTVESSVCLD